MDSHVVFKIDSGGKKKPKNQAENPHRGWGRKITMVSVFLDGTGR